jgi:hypothetical protein
MGLCARCCHDVVDIKDSWLSPMEKGQNDLYAELMERSEKQGNTETVDMENVETTTWTWVQAKAELAALYATAKSQESQIYNESEKEGMCCCCCCCMPCSSSPPSMHEGVQLYA